VPTRDLYLKYNTLPINELHEQQLLILVHKFVFHPEQLPSVFIRNNYFTFNDQVRQYNVRTKTTCISITVAQRLVSVIRDFERPVCGTIYHYHFEMYLL